MLEVSTILNVKKIKEISTRQPIETLAHAVALIGGSGIVNQPFEQSFAIFLDSELCPICYSKTGHGDSHHCSIDLKSVVALAILQNASNVALLHTHPPHCGKFTGPSQKDIETTKEVEQRLNWFGINLLDAQILYYHDEDKIGTFSLKDFTHYLEEEQKATKERSRQVQTVARIEELYE